MARPRSRLGVDLNGPLGRSTGWAARVNMALLLSHTLLCVPGHDDHKVAHGLEHPQVLWDLEDAVPVEYHDLALDQVLSVCRPVDLVRVGSVEDANQVSPYCAAVMVGKWEGGYSQVPRVVPLVESPEGLWQLQRSRVGNAVGVCFGPQDFTTAMGLPGQFHHPIVTHLAYTVLLWARACGVTAIHPPGFSLTAAGATFAAEESHFRGYDAQVVLHPSHIPIVESVYRRDLCPPQFITEPTSGPETFQVIGTTVLNPATLRACRKSVTPLPPIGMGS